MRGSAPRRHATALAVGALLSACGEARSSKADAGPREDARPHSGRPSRSASQPLAGREPRGRLDRSAPSEPDVPKAYEGCTEEGSTGDEDRGAVCAAWRKGRKLGRATGRKEARQHIRRATEEGDRLRIFASVALATIALGGLGAMGGMLYRTRLARRRSPGYADHVRATVSREVEAIRALSRADELTGHIGERLEEPLARLERRVGEVAGQCRPLERRGRDATARAHLEELYRRLDRLADRAERLRVELTVWRERLSGSGAEPSSGGALDEEGLASALEEATEALEASIEESS